MDERESGVPCSDVFGLLDARLSEDGAVVEYDKRLVWEAFCKSSDITFVHLDTGLPCEVVPHWDMTHVAVRCRSHTLFWTFINFPGLLRQEGQVLDVGHAGHILMRMVAECRRDPCSVEYVARNAPDVFADEAHVLRVANMLSPWVAQERACVIEDPSVSTSGDWYLSEDSVLLLLRHRLPCWLEAVRRDPRVCMWRDEKHVIESALNVAVVLEDLKSAFFDAFPLRQVEENQWFDLAAVRWEKVLKELTSDENGSLKLVLDADMKLCAVARGAIRNVANRNVVEMLHEEIQSKCAAVHLKEWADGQLIPLPVAHKAAQVLEQRGLVENVVLLNGERWTFSSSLSRFSMLETLLECRRWPLFIENAYRVLQSMRGVKSKSEFVVFNLPDGSTSCVCLSKHHSKEFVQEFVARLVPGFHDTIFPTIGESVPSLLPQKTFSLSLHRGFEPSFQKRLDMLKSFAHRDVKLMTPKQFCTLFISSSFLRVPLVEPYCSVPIKNLFMDWQELVAEEFKCFKMNFELLVNSKNSSVDDVASERDCIRIAFELDLPEPPPPPPLPPVAVAPKPLSSPLPTPSRPSKPRKRAKRIRETEVNGAGDLTILESIRNHVSSVDALGNICINWDEVDRDCNIKNAREKAEEAFATNAWFREAMIVLRAAKAPKVCASLSSLISLTFSKVRNVSEELILDAVRTSAWSDGHLANLIQMFGENSISSALSVLKQNQLVIIVDTESGPLVRPSEKWKRFFLPSRAEKFSGHAMEGSLSVLPSPPPEYTQSLLSSVAKGFLSLEVDIENPTKKNNTGVRVVVADNRQQPQQRESCESTYSIIMSHLKPSSGIALKDLLSSVAHIGVRTFQNHRVVLSKTKTPYLYGIMDLYHRGDIVLASGEQDLFLLRREDRPKFNVFLPQDIHQKLQHTLRKLLLLYPRCCVSTLQSRSHFGFAHIYHALFEMPNEIALDVSGTEVELQIKF